MRSNSPTSTRRQRYQTLSSPTMATTAPSSIVLIGFQAPFPPWPRHRTHLLRPLSVSTIIKKTPQHPFLLQRQNRHTECIQSQERPSNGMIHLRGNFHLHLSTSRVAVNPSCQILVLDWSVIFPHSRILTLNLFLRHQRLPLLLHISSVYPTSYPLHPFLLGTPHKRKPLLLL